MKTQHILYLSIGLNAVLIGVCGYLFTEPSSSTELSPDRMRVETPALATAASARTLPTVAPSTPTFHWRQIESESFPTYIANLRSIGIPEPTLRNIVSAEVAEQYAEKRQAIQASPAPTAAARREKKQLLEQLPQVQETVVTSLLSASLPVGSAGGRSQLVAGSSPTTQEQRNSPEVASAGTGVVVEADVPALLPAVLVAPDPATPLSELQIAEWLKLEQDFVDRIGGTNQNPSDPAYRVRWQSAQEISDAMFRAKFGTEALLRHNIEAGRRLGSE